jgi:transposase
VTRIPALLLTVSNGFVSDIVKGGLAKALDKDPRSGACKKLDRRADAQLIALARTDEGPDESDPWSLRAVTDELVELGLVGSISHEAVRQSLKNNTTLAK